MRLQDLARRQLPAAIAVLLVVLLAVLAVLQWRWTGEVSAMERQRMRSSVVAAGTHFAEDFDKEVTRAFLFFHFFHPEPERAADVLARVVRQYDRWNAEAPYPDLVRDVFAVGRVEGGEPQIVVLQPSEHRFVPCPWPPELEHIRQHLLGHRPPPHPSLAMFGMVVPDLPGLVIPLGFPSPHGPAGHAERAHITGAHLIVRLDLRAITGEIFPALTRQHFGGSQGHGTDYVLAVVESAHPEKVLYRSDPSVPAAAFRTSEARLDMLELRRFEELRSLWGDEGERHDARRRMSGHFLHWGPPPGAMEHARAPGPWTLIVKHRNGSLEEAVTAMRCRNLAVSLGVLGLLGATAGMLMVTTQRAQRLARQQIEFVAGVTHELNTPLTAMRSAGQNLADGVVTEPEQVRRYGTLIESEGRRLSNMVGQALEFAGIQSGRRVYHPQPVEVAEIVDGALQDSRWLLQEKRVEVEREVEPDLPPVLADGAALRRALQNLLENAVKYGGKSGSSGWIGVSARRAPSGQVEIRVADRGPGIRREDLPHLFEPFFRGRDAAATTVPGSGLGLSLVRHTVEAHGGKVAVESSEEGSVFTLRLPAAVSAAGAAAAVEEPA